MDIRYARLTVEGDRKTEWICGCFQTTDGFFKFCGAHDDALTRAIRSQIDELDTTMAVGDEGGGGGSGGGSAPG